MSAAAVRRLTLVCVLALVVMLSGCRFDGIDSMVLPGGKGTGDDALKITVELPDVGTLTTNAVVKVDDVAVGTVTEVRVEKWHAVAELSLEPDVVLPANALAKVGVNTLLGAAFVELVAPASSEGTLRSGDRITLDRGRAYPSTEQVLSAASLALNGGGLEQIATITTELNKVLGGNDRAVGDLLPRLDSFVGTLDDQRGEILAAVRDMARLSKRFAKNRGVITAALDEVGPALEVLAKNRPDLTKALTALTRLSDVATPLVARVKEDLLADLRDLAPVLEAVSAAGNSAVSALGFAVTFPFAPETVQNACRGSYCNLTLMLDLTNSALLNGFVRPDGSLGIPGLPGLPDLGALLGGSLDGLTGLLNGLTGSASAKPPAKGGAGAKAPGSSPDLGNTLEELLGGILGGGR
ncbi:MAG: MCE family protein [Propionibacteriales bacterium]|nr:MCE family protein [Propionibacteriales bacterium]